MRLDQLEGFFDTESESQGPCFLTPSSSSKCYWTSPKVSRLVRPGVEAVPDIFEYQSAITNCLRALNLLPLVCEPTLKGKFLDGMTGGERYLAQQAKRRRKEYLEALPSPKLPRLEVEGLALRDAPSRFRERLQEILHRAPHAEGGSTLGKVVFDSVDMARFDAGATDFECMGGHAATIIGSSQQGKTSLLNSLLGLFGFLHPGLVFPQADLLPTHIKDGTGLPFPLRLEYGPKYELVLQRWDGGRLQDVMCKVAERALVQNAGFFEDLESGFEDVATGSFLQFLAEHGHCDASSSYTPSASAVESLGADGGMELHDFAFDQQPSPPNPSLQVHKAVCKFLIQLVEDACWFRYERVTLRCPSQLLKHLNTGSQAMHDTCILDLPGVGIVDDNNFLVEELVLRDVVEAGTVIVLTGERSFTQDIIHVLKSSVFERLLDPLVVPRPTVAITNSRNLRGLKEEEMGKWRAATLHGSLGWNTEVRAFADEVFSGRRHRDLQSLEPDLFPNDLQGFLDSRKGAHEKGVSMLVGYFLQLPQEALIASVTDVLERARSVMEMVDQLWQAEKVTWKGLRSCRLMKEVKQLRDEEFMKDLDAELTFAAQKKIFGFEIEANSARAGAKTLELQMQYIQDLFCEQKCKLAQRFDKLKASKGDFKQEIPKMVKESLIHIASQWDENVGDQAFKSFLSHGEKISRSLYQKWARKLFHGVRKDGIEDKKQEHACQFMVTYLNSTVEAAIKKDTFKYTLTHGLRLQAWNLDLKDIIKVLGIRRGRSASVAFDQVWFSVQELMRSKEAYFREHMLEHMSLQSSSIKQLIRLLKQVILSTFEDCERSFAVVMDALERIANGKLAISEDPVVILREELESLVKIIERYLENHREMRDSFGAQELKKVLQTQSEV